MLALVARVPVALAGIDWPPLHLGYDDVLQPARTRIALLEQASIMYVCCGATAYPWWWCSGGRLQCQRVWWWWRWPAPCTVPRALCRLSLQCHALPIARWRLIVHAGWECIAVGVAPTDGAVDGPHDGAEQLAGTCGLIASVLYEALHQPWPMNLTCLARTLMWCATPKLRCTCSLLPSMTGVTALVLPLPLLLPAEFNRLRCPLLQAW